MTKTQRDAVDKINAVRNNFHRKFYAEIKPTFGDWIPDNATPSEWVNVITLMTVHHIRRTTIDALVKQGILEMQPTDGFGNEVKVANPAYIWR